MNITIDHLRRLLENIRTIGFWRRLFGWRPVKDQLIDATGDLQRLLTDYANAEDRIARTEQQVSGLLKDLDVVRDDARKKQSEIDRLLLKAADDATRLLSATNEMASTKTALASEQEANRALSGKNDLLSQRVEQLMVLQTDEENRKRTHDEQMATLRQYQDTIRAERAKEVQAGHAAELERLNDMKDTWVRHQENARQTLKTLCARHTLDYVDKVPFKGDPDNTVSICGEFIIFDAKSPKGDGLSNFPAYIKEQSEKAKKYASQDNVKKWIFFVVPANTLAELKTFVHHLGDYQVFIVSIDALEPILLSMKKIEEYEFAEQLSPEDRENICRILGKFAHLFKRRVQIDTFFINQFMELAYKCEGELPAEVLEKAAEFERAEKLNPPQEKRVKAIPMSDLEKALTKVRNDANNKGILLEDDRLTDGLNLVPLYKRE